MLSRALYDDSASWPMILSDLPSQEGYTNGISQAVALMCNVVPAKTKCDTVELRLWATAVASDMT